jgi:DNA-binding CsgD family transcriptional regulator
VDRKIGGARNNSPVDGPASDNRSVVPCGVIVTNSGGSVRLITPRARHWLREYFDGPRRLHDALPVILERWIRQELTGKPEAAVHLHSPLVRQCDGRRLIIRLLSAPNLCLLIFEEEQQLALRAAGAPLALTRRQSEILSWVVEGKTNPAIAKIVGCSPRTIQHHLSRIYRKLGVETRTAAALMSYQAARALDPRSKVEPAPTDEGHMAH